MTCTLRVALLILVTQSFANVILQESSNYNPLIPTLPTQTQATNVRTKLPTKPTHSPTIKPTIKPTRPTKAPTIKPTRPTKPPTKSPTFIPTLPTKPPTKSPTHGPTRPTKAPTKSPTKSPTKPTKAPTKPTKAPSKSPTKSPTKPTKSPSKSPTNSPTEPTMTPTLSPTMPPSISSAMIDASTGINIMASIVMVIVLVFLVIKMKHILPWGRFLVLLVTKKKNLERLSGIISIICFILSAFVSLFGVTNFFGAFKTKSWCIGVYIAVVILYSIGKVALFFLFSYRMESIIKLLNDPKLKKLCCGKCKYNEWIFYVYRIIAILIILGAWTTILVLMSTGNNHIDSNYYNKYCGSDIEGDDKKTNAIHGELKKTDIIMGVLIADILFTVITAIIYTLKLWELKNAHYNPALIQSERNTPHSQTKKESKRLLPIILLALITSAILLICTVWKGESFYFMEIDGVINSLCIYWMFTDCCNRQKKK